MIERMAMPNISKANLMDKDIKALPVKEKKYIKACGNPKELYIWIYPSKKKTFSLLYDGHYYMIKEFREGIFSVADARKEAIKMLKDLENGKDPKEQKENFYHRDNLMHKNTPAPFFCRRTTAGAYVSDLT